MAARTLMVQGTASHVGKSLLVAGLGRAFTRRGLRVRPFKPQNMSNNAAATPDGEIGRAQALQARACGVAPSVLMNPVLLKPETRGCQVVVRGRVRGHSGAADYPALKATLLDEVLSCFGELAGSCDLVLVEGAGSPAEVNLRRGDIANMGFALAAEVPVVLVGDIDRGGVIASLLGTLDLLAEAERALVRGLVVNRFRGDVGLFADGVRFLEARSGLPVLGVVPWFAGAGRLPAEDAVELESRGSAGERLRVVVPLYSAVANTDDLDPLAAEPEVELRLVARGEVLPEADLILLPGSKSTIADLAVLRAEGWDVDIAAHVRRGGRVLGLCAGYQLLGTALHGPDGRVEGLGLLDVETWLDGDDKRVTEVAGTHVASGEAVRGYEIHVGRTSGAGTARPFLALEGGPDGAVAGGVAGCYVHGLFASDGFRHAYLDSVRPMARRMADFEGSVEAALDGLAAHLEAHLDLDALLGLAGCYSREGGAGR